MDDFVCFCVADYSVHLDESLQEDRLDNVLFGVVDQRHYLYSACLQLLVLFGSICCVGCGVVVDYSNREKRFAGLV